MPKSKEYLSASESESGSDVEPKEKKKKLDKKESKEPAKKPAKAAPSKSSKSNDSEETKFSLGKMRFATVCEFRGTKMVNIREFYDADGEMRPGKKGIALSVDQWKKLKDAADDIDAALEALD